MHITNILQIIYFWISETEYFTEKECSGWYDMHIDNSVKVWLKKPSE